MTTKKHCISTGIDVTNDQGSVSFPCPACGDSEIVRSKHARQIVAKYKCPKCGFEGPN